MEGKEIGKIFHYFEKIGVAAIELTDTLKLGDTIRIVGGESDFTEVVSSMQIEGKNVEKAKAGQGVGIKLSEKVHKGYKVYRA
jgi:U32 family peptidase